MKNPLYKRLPRELKQNFGKYLALFLFLVLTIGFCSGYEIATGSLAERLARNYNDYKTEDGHFTLTGEMDESLRKVFEENDCEIYELFYKDKILANDHTLRIYEPRTAVNLAEAFDGKLPEKDNEIVIDRLYAKNNQIAVGDKITVDGKHLTVCGTFVIPDYTSQYKNNTDFMFDALTFSTALMTREGFDHLSEAGLNYNYAWKYHDRTLSENEKYTRSENLLNALKDCITENVQFYRENLEKQAAAGALSPDELQQMKENTPVTLTDYVPSYGNSALNFAKNDVGRDNVFMKWLLYITIAVIALATAIATKSTVEQESSVIGTLRASGYRQRELIGHYIIIPVIVMILAALVGNVMGYTFMNSVCADMYYGSYSLPVYIPHITINAFLMTTIVPVGIVFLINLLVLTKMMRLPPLQFLRKEFRKKKKSSSVRLHFGSFALRFRLRVIFRNIQAYLVLFVGIFFANMLLIFSVIWQPLFDNYREVVLDHQISEYQYILKLPEETKTKGAEKFSVCSLKNEKDEDISIYGISEKSAYLKQKDFSRGKIYFSSAYADKYGVHDGDTIKLTEQFGSGVYHLTVDGIYDYPPSLCVFMNIEDYRELFNQEEGSFSGYFSDEKITDISEESIATVIGTGDLTNAADQLESSVGFVKLFAFFAAAIYVLMIYILSKMITERNSRSVSVLKILGYKTGEISSLYNFATGAVVLASIAVSLPVITVLINWIYHVFMLEFKGWMTFIFDPIIYPQTIAIGCICFLAAYLLELRRVRKIPMNEAIKDIE